MKKVLSEMTLEELWKLFPIFLKEHNSHFKEWYIHEEERLKKNLNNNSIVRISHIGSTAVDTIWAKPIIDIMIEVTEDCDFINIKNSIINSGYICMSEDNNRISFNKGYTIDGFEEKVYHLHLRNVGDNDELYFRDYLIDHLSVAKEYESLKLDLWKKYEYNRNAYTESKTEFIKTYTEKAKKLYKNRYC